MPILQDIWLRIKAVPRDDWMVAAIIFLVALLAFGLGRLSIIYSEEGEFKIEYPQQSAAAVLSQNAQPGTQNAGANESDVTSSMLQVPSSGGYVASKTGSKYHLPWCAGAQSIKEENKIYFATKAEAEARGYTPAANCKGL
ncbi:MAG TPA: hypothetical protein VI957_01160 [Candidatus Paceibacterota bacterium]